MYRVSGKGFIVVQSIAFPPYLEPLPTFSRRKQASPLKTSKSVPIPTINDDMDMDFDLPQPEELEWLEANSALQEEEDEEENYFQPPEPYFEQEPPKHHQPPPPSPPPQKTVVKPKSSSVLDSRSISEPQLNGQKRRPQSENVDVLLCTDIGQPGSKRSKIECVGAGEDEDWLTYRPQDDEIGRIRVVEEEEVVVPKEKIVSRFASEIDGDCIPITGLNGDRVYAKINRVEIIDGVNRRDMKLQPGGLTVEPIRSLLQKVEQEAFSKALDASSKGQIDVLLPQNIVSKEQLWVDKYSPNSFTELLSDEQINREVLLWLKQWDSCVFGSEIRSTGDEVLSALKRHSSIHQKPSGKSFIRKNGWSRASKDDPAYSSKFNTETAATDSIEEVLNKKSKHSGPPEQKIILLCGPPGLGKTTLAHVAAKHCGYHVLEINASDDRSSSTIEAKIQDAVQMNSVMADSKPRCLVIDEIDGALGEGKGAVEAILKMVSAERRSDNGSGNLPERQGQSGKPPSKKKNRKGSLSRPVICICNDLYAPALRQLRQVAMVYTFVQPTVSRVVNRLKYICNKEGLRTSSIALTALAEYTRCDIRSCLNTLQFLHKKNETLNMLEISSQVVGQKDISRSIIDVWKEIFQKKKSRRQQNFNHSCNTTTHEFNSLYSLIASRGDYELMFDGIHENLLQLNYHDPAMQKTVKCINSLGHSDVIHQYVMQTQKMALYVYQPPIAITAHRIIAQVEKPNILWPKSSQRHRTLLMEKKEVFSSWHCKIWPNISRHLSTKSFVEDTISLLLHILAPRTLRPVALHSMSEKEKYNLTQLVDKMVSYSITYKNVKLNSQVGIMTREGALDAPMLVLDPLITEFICFKDHKSVHYELALAVKEILVHEVEKQKILQVSIAKNNHLIEGYNKEKEAKTFKENNTGESSQTSSAASCFKKNMENAKNQVKPRPFNPNISNVTSTSGCGGDATTNVKLKTLGSIKKTPGGSYNFFERFKKLSGEGSNKADNAMTKVTATHKRDSRPLLFKFNEGYTNAVKRPVRIHEFLL